MKRKNISWPHLLFTLALCAIFAGVWWHRQPPAGARAEVIVELYSSCMTSAFEPVIEECDGDQKAQIELLGELAKEYQGPIKFSVKYVGDDVNPTFTPLKPGDVRRVEGIPNAQVLYRWLDKNDKFIEGGNQYGPFLSEDPNGQTNLARALLVDLIEDSQKNLNQRWHMPVPITRHLPK